MTLAPNPGFPENAPQTYEEKMGVNAARRGPLRFEEGIATDTDVPSEFAKGVMQGYVTAPGRSNHNANVYEKWPAETLAERAHVGSAAWVEAPTQLSNFVQGSFSDFSAPTYETTEGSNAPIRRRNPATVSE